MSQESQSKDSFSLFKCRVLSCKYFFKSGSVAYFTDGRYATKNPTEIEELTAEVEAGHPHIYIDDAERTSDTAMQDPMAALRAKLFKEFQEQQKSNKEVDTGNTDNSHGDGAGTGTTSGLLARVQAASNSSK